jgi:hypothetical protein
VEIKLTDRESDGFEALLGVIKSIMSRVPVVGEAMAGWEAYERSKFERNLKSCIIHLKNTVKDPGSLFSDEWVQSEAGQQFTRKVFDSALDAELEDKQELFINAFINGIQNKDLTDLEKLKFVDILRHLSRSALDVLAEMHKRFKDKVPRPGDGPYPSKSFQPVFYDRVAEDLSNLFHPALTDSVLREMASQGLFSNVGMWSKRPDGSYGSAGGFDSQYLAYTDFTCRFVEFVTTARGKQLLAEET